MSDQRSADRLPDEAADRIALQDVMLNYAAGIDERDFELYRSCFADAVEVLGFGPTPIHGVDVWLDFVKNALDRFGSTQHMLGPQLATVDGDTAHTRSDLQALHVLKEPEGETYILWATYETDMARIDGAWKITRHRLVSRGSKRG
ncbi:MAG: nuclear transport factor 2 family protein [Gammaproteobacteria bacterium]|nr:nuclear transport factor 2 family protein [Gammaproteobacteria bacterium]